MRTMICCLRERVGLPDEGEFIQEWYVPPPPAGRKFHVTGEEWDTTGGTLPVRRIYSWEPASEVSYRIIREKFS